MSQIRCKNAVLLFTTLAVLSSVIILPPAADTNADMSLNSSSDAVSTAIDTPVNIHTEDSKDVGTTTVSQNQVSGDTTLVYDVPEEDIEGTLPVKIKEVYAGADPENLYFEFKYDGRLSDVGAFFVLIDSDQQSTTGEQTGSNYNMGIDYGLGVGLRDDGTPLSLLTTWDNETGELETIAEEPSSDIVSSDVDRTTDRLIVSVDRGAIGDPTAVDFVVGQSYQNSDQMQYAPSRDKESISFTLSDPAVQPPEETPAIIDENTVSVDGSTLTINTNGTNSIAVSDLPSDVDVSAVSDGGIYNSEDQSILYTDFGSGLPETVTFRLTPGETYAVGDSLTFSIDGTSVTLQVAEPRVSVPADLEGDVTGPQYRAVVGNTEELGAPNLSAAINGWATRGSINGVEIDAPELSALINYWANN